MLPQARLLLLGLFKSSITWSEFLDRMLQSPDSEVVWASHEPDSRCHISCKLIPGDIGQIEARQVPGPGTADRKDFVRPRLSANSGAPGTSSYPWIDKALCCFIVCMTTYSAHSTCMYRHFGVFSYNFGTDLYTGDPSHKSESLMVSHSGHFIEWRLG